MEVCTHCTHDVPSPAACCPHCGRPSLFPNVRAAHKQDERKALNRRYKERIKAAQAQNASKNVHSFQEALRRSTIVVARPLKEVDRLATSDKEGYATYYQLQEAEIRFPDGGEWDILRRTADQALFTGYADKLRFAALSLDGIGLSNYGDFSIQLRESMVAHRSSLFSENSTVFCRTRTVEQILTDAVGHRSTWGERIKLCIAKLEKRLNSSTVPEAFPALLLQQGATSADDRFVEVQVYGPLTIRSIDRVTATRGKTPPPSQVILKALQERLAKFSVDFVDMR
jgi:hypothetical protein